MKMISLETARKMVAEYISDSNSKVRLKLEPVFSGDFGWVFAAQSFKHMKSEDISDVLVGNAPILVDKHAAKLYPLGTAHSLEYFVNNYILFGDPSIIPGPVVEVVGWQSGANKIRATKAIRNHSGIGLKLALPHVYKATGACPRRPAPPPAAQTPVHRA